MRYSKSMIEAVKQVGLYEMMDYAIVDGDNKIIGLYKGNMAKKQAQLNLKGAERQVGVKKPLKIMPVSNKKKGDTVIGIGELTDKQRGEIEEDRKNALAGFDNRIRDAASMDRKDFIKAKELYKRKDVKGLRKHIYSLDTSPLEVVMNLISIQDRPFFDKMYPNTRGGEFLARIAYQHRNLDEKLDENKDDEKKRMKGAKLRLKMGEGFASDAQRRAAFAQGYKAKGKKDKKEEIKEDGHTDVSSAIRQCKTVLEDAMQIMGKLKSMSGEDSLPTWWTNKLAVASNSMNKIRDYLLVPSDGMNEQLQEAMGDMEDLKKVVAELQKASKMHLAQSKRVQAHVDMMKDAGMGKKEDIDERMKLPRQLIDKNKEVMIVKKNKVIVIDKKDKDKYMRQGWELAEKVEITSKELLDNKYKEEKNGAQHFSKVNEDNYVWNFVYDDFGRTKLTTEPDKATHLVYTMEGKDNPQLLKLSEREILDYKKGENNGLSKK